MNLKTEAVIAGALMIAAYWIARRAQSVGGQVIDSVMQLQQDAAQAYDNAGLTQANNWLGGMLDPLGIVDKNGSLADHIGAIPGQVVSMGGAVETAYNNGANAYGAASDIAPSQNVSPFWGM